MNDAQARIARLGTNQRPQDILLTDQEEMGCRMLCKKADSRRHRH
jgi:hypothetical protein